MREVTGFKEKIENLHSSFFHGVDLTNGHATTILQVLRSLPPTQRMTILVPSMLKDRDRVLHLLDENQLSHRHGCCVCPTRRRKYVAQLGEALGNSGACENPRILVITCTQEIADAAEQWGFSLGYITPENPAENLIDFFKNPTSNRKEAHHDGSGIAANF